MQHFTLPEILEHEIRQTRGNLETQSILGSLAVQFGRALGKRGALREAIGTIDLQGGWTRLQPNPQDYQTVVAPHSRGALLVAAVFDAFLTIYQNRTADLLRLNTGGTGVLPAGAIHPDLVHRLAGEAAKAAGHILNMCIRALDYLPPVDVTFYEFLRAIITADLDLVGDDQFNYRIAFIEAFRKRGIQPLSSEPLATAGFSADTLVWRAMAPSREEMRFLRPHFNKIMQLLKRFADACFYVEDRKGLFEKTLKYRGDLQRTIAAILAAFPNEDNKRRFARAFGVSPDYDIEVLELRRAIRIAPDGDYIPQIIVALSQDCPLEVPDSPRPLRFRGGSTLVVDLSQAQIKYAIFKDIDNRHRKDRTQNFLAAVLEDPLSRLMLVNPAEPFAALHAISDLGS